MTIIVASNETSRKRFARCAPEKVSSALDPFQLIIRIYPKQPYLTSPINDDFAKRRPWVVVVSKNSGKSLSRNSAIREYACVVATRVSIIAHVGKEAEPVNLYRRRMQKGYISFLRADR